MNLVETVKTSQDEALAEMVRKLSRTDDWLSRLRPAPCDLRFRRGLRRGGRRWLRR